MPVYSFVRLPRFFFVHFFSLSLSLSHFLSSDALYAWSLIHLLIHSFLDFCVFVFPDTHKYVYIYLFAAYKMCGSDRGIFSFVRLFQ